MSNPTSTQRSARIDSDGVIIDGRDLPLGNGWKFRVMNRGKPMAELFVQLIDRNGSPLMEGYMMNPEASYAEFVEAQATVQGKLDMAMERLQAIIDWADLAIDNASEFNKHGVKNLSGPVFDAARQFLDGDYTEPTESAE